MTPTDEQLEAEMGRACGWVQAENVQWFKWALNRMSATCERNGWLSPDEQTKQEKQPYGVGHPPLYCHDRNLLPDVWDAVFQRKCWQPFLRLMLDCDRMSHASVFAAMKAEPRQHVIAALKALNRWPKDWSEPAPPSTPAPPAPVRPQPQDASPAS